MRLAVIKEGKVLIWIDDPEKAVIGERIEPTRLRVFYNPVMEFNRDISVIALQAYIDLYSPHKPIKVIEPLSATGVRGLRYAIEVDGIEEVILNDVDKFSWNIINLNVKLNNLKSKVKVFNRDASSLMHSLHRENPLPILVVDLDPYGSPAPFLDAALSLVGHRGMLAVTATDLAVLGGTKKHKAFKRYWTKLTDVPQKKEVAVRTLLGFIARIASSHDKSIRPLLSYYSDHYVRVYVLVERNSTKALRTLERNIGYIIYCNSTGYAFLSKETVHCSVVGDKGEVLGPIWVGDLFDKTFVKRMSHLLSEKYRYVATVKRINKLLNIIINEANVQKNVYQYIPSIASKIANRLPQFSNLLECLRGLGLYSTRTHFDPLGIRTEAKYNELYFCIAKSLSLL